MNRQFRILLGLVALALFLVPASALASHYRGGSADWTVTSGNTVQFEIITAWRSPTSSGWGQTWFYGDGANGGRVGGNGTNLGTFTDSTGRAYSIYRNTLSHTYSSNTTTYTAYFSSCCRISGIQNASSSYRVESIVNLGGGNNTSSPAIGSPQMIQMVGGAQNSVQLAVVDPDTGDSTTCTWANSSQAGSGLTAPPSWLSLSSGCLLTGTSEEEAGDTALARVVLEGSLTQERWFRLASVPVYEAGVLNTLLPTDAALLFVRARVEVSHAQVDGTVELLSTATITSDRAP